MNKEERAQRIHKLTEEYFQLLSKWVDANKLDTKQDDPKWKLDRKRQHAIIEEINLLESENE